MLDQMTWYQSWENPAVAVLLLQVLLFLQPLLGQNELS
jgi:hypothetical protein